MRRGFKVADEGTMTKDDWCGFVSISIGHQSEIREAEPQPEDLFAEYASQVGVAYGFAAKSG